MWNSSIWPINRTLSDATTPGQSGRANNGNKVVHSIPQSLNITGARPSYCLVSYPEHFFTGILPLCRDAVSAFYNTSWLGICSGKSTFYLWLYQGKEPDIVNLGAGHTVLSYKSSQVFKNQLHSDLLNVLRFKYLDSTGHLSSNFTGCSIHIALYLILAKALVNYYLCLSEALHNFGTY